MSLATGFRVSASLLILAAGASAVPAGIQGGTARDARSRAPDDPAARERDRMPGLDLRFEALPGGPVARGRSYDGALRPDGVDLRLPVADGAAVEAGLRFVAASPGGALEPGRTLPGRSHYLLGRDRSKWVRRVPHLDGASRPGLAPGVDLDWRARAGDLEFVVRVAPGADAAAAAFALTGVRSAAVAADGSLVASLPGGTLRLSRPVAWEETGSGRRPVPVRYARRADGSFAFAAPARDPSRTLVIDPVLTWSSPGHDGVGPCPVYQLDLAPDGSTFFVGNGGPFGDSATTGAFQEAGVGYGDCILGKVDASGTLLWVTYFGGSAMERVGTVAAGVDGTPTISGITESADLPLRDALKEVRGGANDLFVTRFVGDGSDLVWSTYFGSAGVDGTLISQNYLTHYENMAVDAAGAVYLTGAAYDGTFPIVGGFQSARAGASDAFVAKLAPDGQSVLWSTLLGGGASDGGGAVAVGADGAVTVCGATTSLDFPRLDAFANYTFLGSGNIYGSAWGWVARIAPDGGSLVYSSYIGGGLFGGGMDVAVDASGAAFVSGSTIDPTFPVNGGLFPDQPSSNAAYGVPDAFLMKISPDGSAREWSTYLGSSGYDLGMGVAVGPDGRPTVCGITNSVPVTFPLKHAIPGFVSPNSMYGFLTRFEADGSALVYSTLTHGTWSHGVGVDASGGAVVTVGNGLARYDFSAPAAPSDLSAEALSPSSIALSWTDESPDEDSVEIQRREGDGAFATVGSVPENGVEFLDAEVLPARTYAYRVRAVNSIGASEWSAEATATTPDSGSLEVLRGRMLDRPRAGKDVFEASGTIAFGTGGLFDAMNPVTDPLVITVDAGSPISVTIPAGDGGWRSRRSRLSWKSPPGSAPRWRVVLDGLNGRFSLKVDRLDFAVPPDGGVDIRFECGDDAVVWEGVYGQVRPGKFLFRAPSGD